MDTIKINDIKSAILRTDKEYEGIKLPSPQTSGADTQISAYARQQATKIWKDNFK